MKKWTRQPPRTALLTRKAASEILYLAMPAFYNEPRVGFFTPSNAAVRSVGVQGKSFDVTATATDKWEATATTGGPAVSTTDFTIEVLLAMTSTVSLSCIFNQGNDTPITPATDGTRRGLLAFGGSSPFDIYFWGENADLDSGVLWRTDGSIQHVFVTASGGTMRFFRDGRQIASGTTPTMVAQAATKFITIGSRHNAATVGPALKMFKATIRNRALSPTEVLALTMNPWLDFQQTQEPKLNSAGAAAGVFTPYFYQMVARHGGMSTPS